MNKSISVAKMIAKERYAVEVLKIPSLIMMENAGRGIADVVEKHRDKNKILIFCGGGNNAGDGFVAARHLYNRGYDVTVILLKNPAELKGDAKINYDIINNLRLKIKNFSDYITGSRRLNADYTIIDALLGTGVKGEVQGIYRDAINLINNSDAFVISADIPSGLDADTGKPCGIAVFADITVTMGVIKKGLITASGRKHCGKIIVADIGIKI